MTKPLPLAILGGGLCGLYLASRLCERGADFQLFEAEEATGGLARTLGQDGRRFDLGVHALYSKDPGFIPFLKTLPLEFAERERNVRIGLAVNGDVHELDYPFENGIRDLPDDPWEECIVGYMEAAAKGRKSFANLRDWIDNGLGRGISKYFMTPYNTKIWSEPLERISMDLVSGKIEPAPVATILKGALGARTVGRSYQAAFVYPKDGIGALCGYFAARAEGRIATGARLTAVETVQGGYRLRFADGRDFSCRAVVSTIPLKELVPMLGFAGLGGEAEALKTNNTVFVAVSLRQGKSFKRFGDCHWAFFPGDEIFYRLTFMANYSERLSQVCVAEHTAMQAGAAAMEAIETKVIDDFLRRGIIEDEADVAAVDRVFVPYTYPIPTLGLGPLKEEIIARLTRLGIHLLGRNGRWDYINMDQVIARSDAWLAANPHI